MTDHFQIIDSDKAGLNSKESYAVIRGNTSFLRILGGEPEWTLVTATASEDHGRINVCTNQLRLVASALRLGAELKTNPTVEKDWMGREYVTICAITRDSGQPDAVFDSENENLFARFFHIFDHYGPVNTQENLSPTIRMQR